MTDSGLLSKSNTQSFDCPYPEISSDLLSRKNIFHPSVSHIDIDLDKKYLSIDIF
jgi:hypothetical protein